MQQNKNKHYKNTYKNNRNNSNKKNTTPIIPAAVTNESRLVGMSSFTDVIKIEVSDRKHWTKTSSQSLSGIYAVDAAVQGQGLASKRWNGKNGIYPQIMPIGKQSMKYVTNILDLYFIRRYSLWAPARGRGITSPWTSNLTKFPFFSNDFQRNSNNNKKT